MKIKRSIKIPVWTASFRTKTLLTDLDRFVANGKVEPPFELSENENFKKNLKKLSSDPIIIIGNDDYDWGPIIVANNFVAAGLHAKFYWFRPGFEGLQIYEKMGTLIPSFEDRLADTSSVELKTIEVKSPITSKIYKMTVVQPYSQAYLAKIKKKSEKAIAKRAMRKEKLQLDLKKSTGKQ